MHELGIVFYIIRDVKKAALENAVEHVSAVVMNIGEVSTVVPDLLADCWRWAADREPLLKGCELKVNTIPAVTHCDGCGKEYETCLTPKYEPGEYRWQDVACSPECGAAYLAAVLRSRGLLPDEDDKETKAEEATKQPRENSSAGAASKVSKSVRKARRE